MHQDIAHRESRPASDIPLVKAAKLLLPNVRLQSSLVGELDERLRFFPEASALNVETSVNSLESMPGLSPSMTLEKRLLRGVCLIGVYRIFSAAVEVSTGSSACVCCVIEGLGMSGCGSTGGSLETASDLSKSEGFSLSAEAFSISIFSIPFPAASSRSRACFDFGPSPDSVWLMLINNSTQLSKLLVPMAADGYQS